MLSAPEEQGNPSSRDLIESDVDYAVATHIGQKREENQDAYSVRFHGNQVLFAVADGMGGASGGAQASALALRVLTEHFDDQSGGALESRITGAIKSANEEIYLKGRANISLEGMGTTLSGFVIDEGRLLLFNVGDSRVYRIRQNTITQLSNDHTLVGELLNSGALTQEQASRSPVSHMLTRSVGPTPEIEVDCGYLDESPARDDIYLICSDGLYNTISSAEIGFIVGEYRLNDALEHLVGLANMRGGADNITGILVECGSAFPEVIIDPVEPDGSEVAAEAGQKKFVHIDLAEAAAADTFSKVKKEVDISAEILWGAHKDPKRAAQVRDQQDNYSRLEPGAVKKADLTRRAIILCAVVFCITLIAAFWMGSDSDRRSRAVKTPAAVRRDQQILDLSAEKTPADSAIANQEDAAEESARRKALVARLETGERGANETERLAARFKRLESQKIHYDEQLAGLDKPVGPELVEMQRTVESRRADIRARLLAVGQEIDKLDRSLGQWRRRLEESEEIDTVNLASELASYSPELAQKKDAFEQATWQYLKELEAQRSDPSDPAIKQRIEQLIKDRNRQLGEMAVMARTLIETMIARDSHDRGLLSIEHDALVEDEKMLLGDGEYVRIRIGGNEEERKSLENQLRLRIGQLEQEIKELQPRLPLTVRSPVQPREPEPEPEREPGPVK